ncbi:MAG: L-lactate dehydrogenase [Actinomycetales bacterium]|nr:L-lactate dehydrogenase [Actinomycetales bacterium]
MNSAENSKLAVVGAGSVGSSLAYAALIRQSAREIVLYDIDEPKVRAEVLDLAHGTQFTGGSHVSGGADIAAIAGADVVVITAGAKQRPGQSRLDLAGANAAILERMLPSLLERAPDAVYVLVTNPCDVLTVLAQRITGLRPNRIFSSGTVLDSSRLRWLLAERLGVSTSNVHAMIVGEHGDSEFPLWSQASIGAIPLAQWHGRGRPAFTPEELDELADQVAHAAYEVIAGKGATNYAIGLAGARIVEAILRDENTILPVSTVLEDYHGVSGVALSVPTIVNRHGADRVLDVPFSDDEQARFEHSAAVLRESVAAFA